MNSYRDLDIYKESKRLAVEVHKFSLDLPKYELYEEGGQVRRSSKSVAALIVEGYGRRRYKADYIKYLTFAIAECDETWVYLEFLFETGSWTDVDRFKSFSEDYELLSKRINKFIRWVEENL